MALRGSSGGEGKPRFQFKPSRKMLMILGIFLLLVVVIGVALALILSGVGGGGAVAEKTAEPKAAPQVTSVPGAPTAVPPTQLAAPPAGQPTQVVQALVTPVPTPVPVPTQARPGGVAPTVAGVGGGEQALPATASGLGTWLVIIPVGVVLLGVVAWWRWRRSRPSR